MTTPSYLGTLSRALRGAGVDRPCVVIDLDAVSSFTIGQRVFHQKFGYGAVTGIEGDKLEIAFEKAGTKKVIARFLSSSDDIPF